MIKRFAKLPVSLKVVVIWLFLLGLSSFWKTWSDIGARHILNSGSIIAGFICWGLANGLINRKDESRWWAAFFTLFYSLVGLFILAILILEDPNSPNGFHVESPFLPIQQVVYMTVFLLLNILSLLTLVSLKIKALFSQKIGQDNIS